MANKNTLTFDDGLYLLIMVRASRSKKKKNTHLFYTIGEDFFYRKKNIHIYISIVIGEDLTLIS